MNDTASAVQRRFKLGCMGQVPVGEGRRFLVGSLSVAVFRTRDGRIFATQAECPHNRGPLFEGVAGAGRVICPLHGHAFDLATGEPLADCCGPLKTYPVQVNCEGEIFLDL
ncbi:MAG: nitrite reductase (NAD(P)H) small subunit [Chloroflexi bacterium]|nr:nitrite reductase (NAD(P)H) small subunit [Chloroflexota bacterium]